MMRSMAEDWKAEKKVILQTLSAQHSALPQVRLINNDGDVTLSRPKYNYLFKDHECILCLNLVFFPFPVLIL